MLFLGKKAWKGGSGKGTAEKLRFLGFPMLFGKKHGKGDQGSYSLQRSSELISITVSSSSRMQLQERTPLRNSGVPKRGRSKRGRSQKHANPKGPNLEKMQDLEIFKRA